MKWTEGEVFALTIGILITSGFASALQDEPKASFLFMLGALVFAIAKTYVKRN